MKLIKVPRIFSIIFLIALFARSNTICQVPAKTIIRGSVTDAKTGDPISFASVSLKGTTTGTNTDAEGKFFLYISNQKEF